MRTDFAAIRERTDIEALAAELLGDGRRVGRQRAYLCPHGEKTPSLLTTATAETVTVYGGAWGGACVFSNSCTFNVPNSATALILKTDGPGIGATWSGACTGSVAVQCSVPNMNAARTVTWVVP